MYFPACPLPLTPSRGLSGRDIRPVSYTHLFLGVNPIPIKTALNLAGYEVGSLRLPLCAMSDGHLETLRRAMESAHLLQ